MYQYDSTAYFILNKQAKPLTHFLTTALFTELEIMYILGSQITIANYHFTPKKVIATQQNILFLVEKVYK